MRVALMNPDPMPVIRPFTSVPPDECSLQVSPTKLAIFLPVVKWERSSPISRMSLIAVNQPMPGRLRAISKAFLYRSLRQSLRRAARKDVGESRLLKLGEKDIQAYSQGIGEGELLEGPEFVLSPTGSGKEPQCRESRGACGSCCGSRMMSF